MSCDGYAVEIQKENDNKMVCKGIYVRHKAMKPIGIGRYSSGQKQCTDKSPLSGPVLVENSPYAIRLAIVRDKLIHYLV